MRAQRQRTKGVAVGSRCSVERGSITAELAIAMPSVVLVLAVALGCFGLQIERLKLVASAASFARSLGRGDSEQNIRDLARETNSNLKLDFEYLEDFLCVTLSKNFAISSLPSIEVSERQCARKGGL
jgi:hypothetical protein